MPVHNATPIEDIMRDVERRLAGLGDSAGGFDSMDMGQVDAALRAVQEAVELENAVSTLEARINRLHERWVELEARLSALEGTDDDE